MFFLNPGVGMWVVVLGFLLVGLNFEFWDFGFGLYCLISLFLSFWF